jgi:hypothetical protein
MRRRKWQLGMALCEVGTALENLGLDLYDEAVVLRSSRYLPKTRLTNLREQAVRLADLILEAQVILKEEETT